MPIYDEKGNLINPFEHKEPAPTIQQGTTEAGLGEAAFEQPETLAADTYAAYLRAVEDILGGRVEREESTLDAATELMESIYAEAVQAYQEGKPINELPFYKEIQYQPELSS